MSLGKDIFRGFLWNHTGRIVEYALMYAFSVLVARELGAEQNGTYVTIYTLGQFLLLVSGLGFETALTRSIAQFSKPGDTPRLRYVFRTLLRWRFIAIIIAGLLFYVFRAQILGFVTFSDAASRYFILILLYAGLKSFIPLFLSVFVAQFNTRIASLISVSARVLELAAAFYFLSHGYGIESVLLVILGGALYMLVGCLIFARQNYMGESEQHDTRPIIALGATFWLNTIMAYVLEKQGDILLLNTLLGDRKQVGYYDVAYGLMQVVIYGFTIGFSGISLAVFSRAAASDPRSVGLLWKFSAKVIVLLVLPPLIFLAAHADLLIPTIYSAEYASSIRLFQLLVLFQITARLFGSGINADLMLAVNKTKLLVGFGVLAGLINIVLDLFLIPQYRAYGAVIATGIANTSVMIMSAAYIMKRFTVSVSVSFWLKTVAISVASAYVGRFFYQPETVIGIFLSGLMYLTAWLVLAFVLKLFAREDIEFLRRLNLQLSEWATYFALT